MSPLNYVYWVAKSILLFPEFCIRVRSPRFISFFLSLSSTVNRTMKQAARYTFAGVNLCILLLLV